METTHTINSQGALFQRYHSNRDVYAYYVLAILWLVALFRVIDLQVIAVLLQSIKSEFGFSDTQLGILSGFAFAIFYSVLGIPIAYLADRYNRTTILSVSLGVWSAMTAVCGFATNYLTFFLARVGVGIGEAGGYPTTTSLLSDYFTKEKRGRIFAILGSAIPIGILISFVFGGYVNEHYGWRTAYLTVGIPGILLAVLTKWTIKEPLRGARDQGQSMVKPKAEAFTDTVKELWQKKNYCWVILASAFATMAATGSGIWVPSFFTRVHGMGIAETGIWIGILYGIGGAIGTLGGGWLSDKLSLKYGNSKGHLLVCSISSLLVLPFALIVFNVDSTRVALSFQFLVVIMSFSYVGPALALVQNLVGIERRSMSQAINVLFSNLFGLALGPAFVGIFSDIFTASYGNAALGYSILAIYFLGYLPASCCFYRATKK